MINFTIKTVCDQGACYNLDIISIFLGICIGCLLTCFIFWKRLMKKDAKGLNDGDKKNG